MTRSKFELVKALIGRLSPRSACDECIAERLDLGDVGLVSRKMHELAGTPGFESRHGVCSLCERMMKVIRYRSRDT